MENKDLQRVVILDNGSERLRAGFAEEDRPSTVIPAVVGRNRDNELVFGEKGLLEEDVKSIKYPIEFRVITNWEEMENLWHHVFFSRIKVDIRECLVVLSEPLLNPKITREKTLLTMFENFGVGGLCLRPSPILALYGSGGDEISGVVVEVGVWNIQVTPVVDGNCVLSGFVKSDVGGKDSDFYLMARMYQKGMKPGSSYKVQTEIKKMKETLCFVSNDYKATVKNCCNSVQFNFSDGENFGLETEQFECGEILFKPSLVGKEELGVSDLIEFSCNKCEESTRTKCFKNLVLSGGSTLFNGFSQRLETDLIYRLPAELNWKACKSVDPRELIWRGGAEMIKRYIPKNIFISREEFEEYGPNIIYQKQS
eukprot:augustus_masked-scaffold_8-processed-gene-2.1-mRNA-1 protein AED:0.44 eAED:0.44 QI:0/-1/0/1/-1/1/1/0/367